LRSLLTGAPLLLCLAGPLFGAEGGENIDAWKWANFAILAAGLGYLVVKKGHPFFESRRRQIRYELEDANRVREEADARAAGIERKLANLSVEIEEMRAESKVEMEHEAARIERETQRVVLRIQANAEQEITAAVNAATGELRAWAAELAIKLAEEKIRARMDAGNQSLLIEGFAKRLPERERTMN
jgi:F-type H+-transporting ATPase subunit b